MDRARQIMEGNETRREMSSSSPLARFFLYECHCHATSSGPCPADRSSVKEEDPCWTLPTTAVTGDGMIKSHYEGQGRLQNS